MDTRITRDSRRGPNEQVYKSEPGGQSQCNLRSHRFAVGRSLEVGQLVNLQQGREDNFPLEPMRKDF